VTAVDDLDLLRDLGRELTARTDGDLTDGDLAAVRSRLLAAASTDAPATGRRRTGRRRMLRIRILRIAPVAAAVAAVAVLAVTYLGGTGTAPPHRHTDRPTPAAALLDKVALAADDTTVTARPDQFVYLDSTVSFSINEVHPDGTETSTMAKPHRLQEWLSVDGSRPGLKIEQDEAGNPQRMTLDPVTTPTIDDPTYQYLTTLPTDPDRLLAMLRTQVLRENPGDKNPDAAEKERLNGVLFADIGNIIGYNLVPPALSAALYRSAAKIPGVTVLPDLTDATGRHGIAVARTSNGVRDAWIFDKKTYTYLGEREQNLTPGSIAGNGVTAVLGRAVVDHPPAA
jgi:hypothetical protein